jgi:hypothetical protein
MQQEFAQDVLRRLPLAEAALQVWRWVCEPARLDALFEQNRRACYTDILRFPVLVSLIADALLEHGGSGRKSFERAKERGELPVSVQAAYDKLGNLPLPLSEAFLAESTDCLGAVFPAGITTGNVPDSLNAFSVVTVDGKAVKRVPKRLKPLRGTQGGVLGGKALVALEMSTGLVLAMATDPDGESNDSKLVGALLPQVRQRRPNVLWIADRQFCDPTQINVFAERAGDHFLLRFSAKNLFVRDEALPVRTGTDPRGRDYEEERGWLGAPTNKNRRYVRRIRLHRPGEDDVLLVTDLEDDKQYPAVDLLEMYLQRWHIERVFQVITEVFSLNRLIGTTPQGTIFQLAFCLALYNVVQLVRAYVAEGAKEEIGNVSTELLFDDVRRQLIALHEVIEVDQITAVLVPLSTPQAIRKRLEKLLHRLWKERWRKAPKKGKAQHPQKRRPEHASAHRILEDYKAQQKKECQGRK